MGEKMDETAIINVSKRLLTYTRRETPKEDLDHLRGIEGDAARQYFSVFNELIFTQKTSVLFYRQKPPTAHRSH